MTGEQPLTPTEARLLAVLAADPGASQEDIAAKLRVTGRHVRRLLQREPIRQALDVAARAGLREATAILGRGAVRAARALVAMAAGDALADAPRVSAARATLEGAGKLIDLLDLEARVREIEDARGVPKRTGGWQ